MKKFLLAAAMLFLFTTAQSQLIGYCSGSGGGEITSVNVVEGPAAGTFTLDFDYASQGNRVVYIIVRQGSYTGQIVHLSLCQQVQGDGSYTYQTSPYVPLANQYISIGISTGGKCDEAYLNADGIPCNVLPVKLNSFKVKKATSGNVIEWSTASEVNSKSFVIQSSVNGREFTDLGTIAAANSATGSRYNFTDASLTGTNKFYRLKMVDFDGSIQYSIIRKITGQNIGIVLSPNPAKGRVSVYLEDAADVYDIAFINSAGKMVKQLRNISTFETVVSDLPAGVYFVKLVNSKTGDATTEKLVINP